MTRFFEKIQNSLRRTQERIRDQLVLAFTGRLIDDAFWDELLELLIVADVHFELAERLVQEVRRRSEKALIREPARVLPLLETVLAEHLRRAPVAQPGPLPHVYFFIGVNGTGKTTTIAKMAYRLQAQGHRVMFCAADTFRAAAIEQLEIWAHRVGAPVIRHQPGADPAAVVFDAVQALQARGYTHLLVDTAGRLHTKTNLMKELEKMGRVAARVLAGAPHEIFLVLDATTGQNAIQQARVFSGALPVTGIIVTKLDGTAKGGAVLSIVDRLQIPVRFLGVGEQVDDLVPFDPDDFARALIGRPETWAALENIPEPSPT